ncbi:hypothetical protein EV44_g3364 [Erysiphe necator]|uniref:Uncharacterized protein n=1 Tax=Uncinula necator TaxID=52586 RepID=A0A0B1PCH8_UNCNE|nr:hypothetical protein EV44_g3364 [Erysiphe necator]
MPEGKKEYGAAPFSKRALPSEPPDAGNRVLKPKTTSDRISRVIAAKTYLILATGDVFGKGVTNEKMLSEEHSSSDLNYDSNDSVESLIDQKANKPPENGPPEGDFSVLFGITQIRNDAGTSRASHISSNESQHGASSIMEAIKGLLDLNDDYLKYLEIQHPQIGADFLTLLADGASRAMSRERVYCRASKPVPTHN